MDKFFENINGYELDIEQKKVVLDDHDACLVVASAGSGKSLTIVAKILYLINIKKIKPSEILCISFTNASVNDLKRKINNPNIEIYTFHKLALNIIRKNKEIEIVDDNFLEYTIDEFFKGIIIDNDVLVKLLFKYFDKKYSNLSEYYKLLETKQFLNFKKSILRFINLYKANYIENYNYSLFFNKNKGIIRYKEKTKNKIFLLFAFNIQNYYINNLYSQKELDFDGLIKEAIKIIKTKKININYKYIIIDEYQDTSYLRFLLINEIKKYTKAKLLVVGDDYQSIYRFTGCDLKIFLNFKSYFKNSNILKIETTYRNSKQLVDIAGDFICKNKIQIKKQMKANKELNYPIVIKYYKNLKNEFEKLINEIGSDEILVLGRNNNDIYYALNKNFKIENENVIYIKNENLKIKYLTIHKSKGLEAENVIVLNNNDGILGFPSKIKENKVINYLIEKNDKYPYSEERRLFYVALTRTKNRTYLLTEVNNESIFIKELLKNYKNKIKIIKNNLF